MLSSAPVTTSNTQAIFERIIRKRGRECTRCGGRHRDPKYKYCGVCRNLTAAWAKAYRHDHIARKLCPNCVQKKGKVTQTCEYHRKYNNEHLAKRCADQRAKGLCAWGRCQNQSDGWLCEEHRAIHNAYQTKRAKRVSRPWRMSA